MTSVFLKTFYGVSTEYQLYVMISNTQTKYILLTTSLTIQYISANVHYMAFLIRNRVYRP